MTKATNPTKPFTPQPGSLADRVCAFFARNRDDELTTGDIATKFDVPGNSVRPCLASAVAHGWLADVKTPDGRVFRAGTSLPDGYRLNANAPAPLPPAIFGAAPSKPTKGRRGTARLPELDADSLPILVAQPKPSASERITHLLQRLQEPHQYVLLPLAWKHTARKYVDQHNRQARAGTATGIYSLLHDPADGDDQIRLQRTA